MAALPSAWHITTTDSQFNIDVFPHFPGRNLHVLKTPQFSTAVKRAASGRQIRSNLWALPIWQFKVSHEVIRDKGPTLPELQQLWGFFASHYGAYQAWWFYDPYDNAVSNYQFGTGDGSTTTFQLYRGVNAGGTFAFQEPVYGVMGTPTISVAGTPTTLFSYSSSFGQITFNSAPANGAALTWTGTNLFLCHFLKDELDTAQLAYNLWDSKGVEFETTKI